MQPAKDDALFRALRAALPMIARTSGGGALVANRHGACLVAVDDEGREVPDAVGTVHELCRSAGAVGEPMEGPVNPQPGATAWALPLGPYVLAGSNDGRMARESQLRLSLQMALPLIAQVARGEAVMFDRDGRRLMSVLPDGSGESSGLGVVSRSSREAMATGRPNIGPSETVPGAMAVRIPITRDFGFGFNNALAARNEQRLRGAVRRAESARYSWEHIIAQSRAMLEVLSLARRAAQTHSPVWIFGETGTGKELIAQAIHTASSRSHRPFVAVNCAALPAGLIESTLFGYTDGAFTGARKGGHAGLFEEVNGGTLLLDEISEMDPGLQAKLLRVLQEREVTRIGSSRPIPVDVRIISTTNRDLRALADEGKFRRDLFYRLNVVDIRVPPLRERKEDIPLLVDHFVRTCAARLGKLVVRVEPAAMTCLASYHWPGNVRELQNCVERAINLVEGDTISASHLPSYVLGGEAAAPPRGGTLDSLVRRAQRDAILQALRECGGNRTRAASRLGISVTTLWRKLRESEAIQPGNGVPPS